MEVSFGEVLYKNYNIGIGLGNFDGLHVGHMKVIEVLIDQSRSRGITSTLYNFIFHPSNVLKGELETSILTTLDKKVELLSGTSLDVLHFDIFDDEYSKQSPEKFIKNILIEKFNAKLVVVGEDYRFGYMKGGDIKLLGEYGNRYGFDVCVVPHVILKGRVVSSTYIRECIRQGLVNDAKVYLGRAYSVSANVTRGNGLGRQLGYPTANIYPLDCVALPACGVYITKVKVGGVLYEGVSNIGIKQGFNLGMPVIETHILDFKGDIYGTDIEIFFLERIRDMVKFEFIQCLIDQISRDVEIAKSYFLK